MDIDSVLKGHGLGIGGSNIKSIQRGLATKNSADFDITISAVNLNNAIVLVSAVNETNAVTNSTVRGKLTSQTNLRLSGGTSTILVAWQVIEFNNVKSLQAGETTVTSANYGIELSVAITAVNISKSMVVFSFTNTDTGNNVMRAMFRCRIINSQHIGLFGYPSSGNTSTVCWQVIEFN